jgi:hypothetical protein
LSQTLAAAGLLLLLLSLLLLRQDHEKVISIEDMMTSVELDYTENPALIVPSYTHQVRQHVVAGSQWVRCSNTPVLQRMLTVLGMMRLSLRTCYCLLPLPATAAVPTGARP